MKHLRALAFVSLVVVPWSVSAEVPVPKGEIHPTPAQFVLPVVPVFSKGLTGLMVEESQNPDSIRIFRDHARDYVRYRHGEVSAAHAGLSPQQCQDGQPLRNPYCTFVGEDWKMSVLRSRYDSEAADPIRTPPVSKSEYEQAVHSLMNSELDELEEVSEPIIRRVLKTFTSADEVIKLAESTLNEAKCPPSKVLTVIGMKLEEFFPDKKVSDEAIKVFSRVDQCSKGSDLPGAQARYRLGLIHMLDRNCAAAEPVFRRLSEFKNDDGMVSRALYWMGTCSKMMGDRIHADLFKTRIIKWNPIGFHTTQLNESPWRSPLVRYTFLSQPQLFLRSESKPELNPLVRAVEAIQGTRSNQYARDLLNFLKSRSQAAEPEFQIYIAILCERSRDYIGKFQILSRLFRQHPELVSDETLRIFFPLSQMARVQGNHPRVDPLLLLSLMRQESGFNEDALSPVGAVGLMQLMPYTARRLGVRSRRLLFRPDINVRVGIRYFESLVRRFNGEIDLALASYNAGPERVDEWKRRYPTQDRMLFMDLIPFGETRNYVALIGRNYFWYQRLYRLSREPAVGRTKDRRSPFRASN